MTLSLRQAIIGKFRLWSCEVKKGYKVIDIDTHVNPSYDTLVKYVDPSFRPRLEELTPYLRKVGDYTALSLASIPFDRFPR